MLRFACPGGLSEIQPKDRPRLFASSRVVLEARTGFLSIGTTISSTAPYFQAGAVAAGGIVLGTVAGIRVRGGVSATQALALQEAGLLSAITVFRFLARSTEPGDLKWMS